MTVIRIIPVGKSTKQTRKSHDIAVRLPDSTAAAFKASCADMGMTQTKVVERLVRWFAQLPRPARQLICGLFDDDEVAEIGKKRLIESVEGANRPEITDDSEIEIPAPPSKED